jgi:dipeptide/tripeptide permease
VTDTKPGFLAQVKSYPKTFWVANTMEIFERMAWYGFFAVSSNYITGPVEAGGLGFTSEQRGQIQAIVPFLLYLMPVVTGALADRYGYKKMFIIAYVGMILSYYGLGQFKTMPTFLAAFMCVAVAAAIFKPVVVGTVARVTNEGNSSMGFGIFYMMVNIGGFVGPLVAGVVRGMSWKYVFISCSGWAAINLIVVLLFYKDPTTEAGSANRRTLKKVMENAVEVLGNMRFFATVIIALIALMVANQGFKWFPWWPHCVLFVPAWIVLNFIWDLLLPAGSGRPGFNAGAARSFLLKRMHCSNWRFALFLLIMSGFWTSFNQIFLTTPEYIRDFTETRPMVNAGRAAFDALGRPNWINGLAAISENEVLAKFDSLVRQARGVAPSVPPAEPTAEDEAAVKRAAQVEAEKRLARVKELEHDPGLTPADLTKLAEVVKIINTPAAKNPLDILDLVDGARAILAYKVRIQPTELAELLTRVPTAPQPPSDKALDDAVQSLNGRLAEIGRPTFEGRDVDALKAELRTVMKEHGPLVPAEAASAACEKLTTGQHKVDPKQLAVALNVLAYKDLTWPRMDAGRQVNPEHIVNFDALAIVLLQVLVSFCMARFHRFTTMIVGMLVAAVGIGLPVFAGGTMIGPVGGSLLIVVAGIVIFAIGEMMASPTSQEYVGRIAPHDRVAVYMGYYFIAVALGNLFGGILSGQLYGKLARDMQRPDLMWLAFGGLMVLTAFIFLLYDRFALPRTAAKAE